ncbi:MAG: chromate efflux transporter [Chloroflexi bacterium]|nr:chromate efflux transporter [Chloroflexota bacterium]
MAPPLEPTPFRELARIFLRLGATSFGGPAAHIALFREEFVVRRGWLTNQAFLDLLSAANLLPGPSSTEVALGIGRERAGVRGMIVAGTSFIAPAAVLVLAIAMLYQRLGTLAVTAWALAGIQAVVIVVIVRAAGALAPTALPAAAEWCIAVGACLLALLAVHPLLILATAALAMLLRRRLVGAGRLSLVVGWNVSWLQPATGAGVIAVAATGLVPLFLVFLGIGALTFGSGYLLLAFLREAFVLPGLITDSQLLDAVAIGQLTPGPLFTSATFIGYLLEGVPGALVATVAIFLPAFVFVALAHPWLSRMRASLTLGAAMDGVNAATIGLLLAVALELGRAAFLGPAGVVIALGAAVLAWRYRVGTVWLLLGGAVCGVAAGVLGLAI